MVLKLGGQINETSFVRALCLTLDQEPVLSFRFAEKVGSLFWGCRDDLEKIRICSVVETSSPGAGNNGVY